MTANESNIKPVLDIQTGFGKEKDEKSLYYLQNRVNFTTILSKPDNSDYKWNIVKSKDENLYYMKWMCGLMKVKLF